MIEWLPEALLATSLLTLFVLVLREPVRHYFGSRAAYGLWLIPVARLMMPSFDAAGRRSPSLMPVIIRHQPSFFGQMAGQENLLVTLWAIGALALFLGLVIQFRRQSSAILASAAEVGRAGSIRIVRSAAVRGPLAFGIFARIIAVPEDFEVSYSEQEQRLALEHELAHHRFGDLIANAFALVLLCLHWFNPLAWMAYASFRFDQEAACDARVLSTGRNRLDYGLAIAKAASGRALLIAGALDSRSALPKRLKCMRGVPTPKRRLAGVFLVVATIGVALPLTAMQAAGREVGGKHCPTAHAQGAGRPGAYGPSIQDQHSKATTR